MRILVVPMSGNWAGIIHLPTPHLPTPSQRRDSPDAPVLIPISISCRVFVCFFHGLLSLEGHVWGAEISDSF